MNITQHVSELYERGFTVLPAYFSAAQCQKQRNILDGYWKSQGSPSLSGKTFGFTIHPLLPNVPDLAPFLDVPEAIEIMSEALRDEVRIVHVGARVSGPQSAERIEWHNHYASNGNGASEWNQSDLARRDRLERVLAGVYTDGTLPESGALITLPRRYNDPLGEPRGALLQAWPGEAKVEAPPGSIAIFDTALWHAAAKGTGHGMRRLWGAHYQGWSETRCHPEDNQVDATEIAGYKAASPRLQKLIGN